MEYLKDPEFLSLIKKDITWASHQEEAVRLGIENQRYNFFIATGAGKQRIEFLLLLYLYVKYMIDIPIIVTTTSSLISVQEEFDKTVQGLNLKIIDNYNKVEQLQERDNIFVLQYSRLKNFKYSKYTQLARMKKVCIIFDESHKVKNTKSQVYRCAYVLSQYANRVYSFTATPAMSRLLDLYSIVELTTPGYLGSEERFKGKYIIINKRPVRNATPYKPYYEEVVDYKNTKELSQLLSKVCYSFFPTKEIKYKYIKISLKDKVKYDEDIKRLLATKEREKWGSLLHEIQHITNMLPEKLNVLLRIINKTANTGIIVFTDYHKTMDALTKLISEKTPYEVLKITGKDNRTNREKAKIKFNEDPSNKVLLVSRAGGESLNLHSTNRILLYDIPKGIGAYIQLVGRVNRYFSSFDHIDLVIPFVENTIDEYRLFYLQKARNIIKDILANEIVSPRELKKIDKSLWYKLRQRYLWR